MEEIFLEHLKLLLFWNARSFPSKQWWRLQSPGLGVLWASLVPSSPLFNSSPRKSQCIVGTGGILRQNLHSAPGQLETQRLQFICQETWFPRVHVRNRVPRGGLYETTGVCEAVSGKWLCLTPSFPALPLSRSKSCALSLLTTAPAWARVWWFWTVFPLPKPVFPFYS